MATRTRVTRSHEYTRTTATTNQNYFAVILKQFKNVPVLKELVRNRTDADGENLFISQSCHHCLDVVGFDVSHRIGGGDGRSCIGRIKTALISPLILSYINFRMTELHSTKYIIYLRSVGVRGIGNLSPDSTDV